MIAFNLDKSITLDYAMTRGTQEPKDSQTRTLAVLPIAQSHLPKPLITQASEAGEGPELDVSQLTTNATLRANSYPHIALRQFVWLKAKGTSKGGGVYSKTFWQPPGSQTNATWINQGFYTHSGFPLADLQSLEDGSDLELKFKAGFGGTQVESEAVTFALRTYKIKAYENIVPTLDSVKGSPSGVEIPNAKFTVETAVTLSGVAAKGQQIEVFDGSNPKGKATADPATGIWVLPVTGLSVAAHSFKAKALYGAGAESAARTLTVTAATAPTLTSVKGSPSGVEIPNAKFTVETAVTLSGVAAKGQQIEVFDSSNPKGKATADPATGIWVLPVTGLSVAAHSFKAKALYGAGAESAARTLTVTAATAPTLTSVKGSPSGADILPGGNTRETAVTLSGSAAKGQSVRVFDGVTSKGDATADQTTGIWKRLVSGLSIAEHNFTAKALYGVGGSSQQYKVNIINYDIEDFQKCASEDIPANSNYSTPLITLKWQVTNPQGGLIGKINLAKQLYIFAAQGVPGPQSTTKVQISLNTPCSKLSIEHHLIVSNNPTGRINYYNTGNSLIGTRALVLDTYTNTAFSGSNIKRLEIIILGGGNMYFDNIKMEY